MGSTIAKIFRGGLIIGVALMNEFGEAPVNHMDRSVARAIDRYQTWKHNHLPHDPKMIDDVSVTTSKYIPADKTTTSTSTENNNTPKTPSSVKTVPATSPTPPKVSITRQMLTPRQRRQSIRNKERFALHVI